MRGNMDIKFVEFICDENMATPGALPTPRPANRPRPTVADLEKIRSSTQLFEGEAKAPAPSPTATKHTS